MSAGEYAAGLAFFAATWGSAAYVSAIVVRRRLPRMDRAPLAAAFCLVFLAALVGVHLVPGALGILSRWTAAATALLTAVLVSRVPVARVSSERARTPLAPAAATGWSRTIALIAIGAVAAFALAALWSLRLTPPTHVDAMSFALPEVAGWIQTGSIWHVGAYLPLLQVRTYPNNGDVLALATILPWRSDAFLRLLPLPLLSMVGLGVYAAGRELGGRPEVAAVAAAAAVSAKAVADSAVYDLKPDTFMYATFALGVAFVLRHARTRATSDLVLGGLGIGLSFGARWYGMSSAVVVLAVWGLALLAARWPPREAARTVAALAGLVLAAGGFWLVRNIALTGNPLYPIHVGSLLPAPPDVLTDRFGFTVADRLTDAGFARHELLPALKGAFGFPGLLAVAGALGVLALRVRGRLPDWRLLAVVAIGAGLALVYTVLPGGAQGLASGPVPGIVEQNLRWLVPGFLLWAVAVGPVATALPAPARVTAEAAGAVFAALAARAAFPVEAWRVALVAVVLAGLWAFTPLLRRAPAELARRGWRAAVPAAAALLVLAIAVAGELHQRSYNDHRYAGDSAAVDWTDAHAPEGRKVGVAGYFAPYLFVPTYGLAGPRLENDVGYVGPVVDDQLRDYTTASAFRRALRRGRYDLLAVGTLSRPDLSGRRRQRFLAHPPTERWARGAGFREVARDSASILLARP